MEHTECVEDGVWGIVLSCQWFGSLNSRTLPMDEWQRVKQLWDERRCREAFLPGCDISKWKQSDSLNTQPCWASCLIPGNKSSQQRRSNQTSLKAKPVSRTVFFLRITNILKNIFFCDFLVQSGSSSLRRLMHKRTILFTTFKKKTMPFALSSFYTTFFKISIVTSWLACFVFWALFCSFFEDACNFVIV